MAKKKDAKLDNLINDDLDNHFSIEFSPLIKTTGYDKDSYRLSRLLIWLKSFYTHIYNARDILGVKKLTTFDVNCNSIDFIRAVTDSMNAIKDKDNILINKEYIKNRFHLTNNWGFTIQALFVSNQLFVPIKTNPIEIYKPYKMIMNEKFSDRGLYSTIEQLKWEKESSYEKERIMNSLEYKQQYPSIVIKQKTSTTQLINWIRKNKDELDSIFAKLEDPVKTKVSPRTLFLGQTVWIFKKEGHSFNQISDKIYDLVSKEESPKELEYFEPILSNTGAKKYFDRFAQYLELLDQK